MKNIVLVGGGGHCRSVIEVLESIGSYSVSGIVQPSSDGAVPVLGYPILGCDDDLEELVSIVPNAFVTVGQINIVTHRRRLYERLKQLGFILPTLISPNAYVSRFAEIEEGTVIMHGAIVNASARLGENGIINSMALVEHDATIGCHCHISTGALVNGGVSVEDYCFIGSGAVLHQGVRIGANSVIGAGCVIAGDVLPGTTVKLRNTTALEARRSIR